MFNRLQNNPSKFTTIMSEPERNQLLELSDLEDKLDLLIVQYTAAKDENSSLKQEKAQLLEKTNLARTRVEAMIARLKAMEHGA